MAALLPLPQTQSVHCIEARELFVVCSKKYSTDTKQTVFDFREGLLKTASSSSTESSTLSAAGVSSSGLAYINRLKL